MIRLALVANLIPTLIALATACSDGRRDANAGDAGDSTMDRTAAAAPGTEADDVQFQWPSDADHPRVELDMALPGGAGKLELELMPELAPESVRRFVELANAGHYDGTTFHRVIPGFMIQGGDPNSRDLDPSNDGRGGDRSSIPDEHSNVPFERGVVALANRGHAGTTTSQFFIMHAENRSLDGHYNAIGRVVEGLEIVDAITRVEVDSAGRWGPKDRPSENVVIRRMTVLPPAEPAPGAASPAVQSN